MQTKMLLVEMLFLLICLNWTLWEQNRTLWEQNLQNATPPSNHYRIFWTLFLNILLNRHHKSTGLDFWSFEFLILINFLKFIIAPYGETKNLNYLENERPESETEWNLVLPGKCSVYAGNYWQVVKVILGHFRFTASLCLENALY